MSKILGPWRTRLGLLSEASQKDLRPDLGSQRPSLGCAGWSVLVEGRRLTSAAGDLLWAG